MPTLFHPPETSVPLIESRGTDLALQSLEFTQSETEDEDCDQGKARAWFSRRAHTQSRAHPRGRSNTTDTGIFPQGRLSQSRVTEQSFAGPGNGQERQIVEGRKDAQEEGMVGRPTADGNGGKAGTLGADSGLHSIRRDEHEETREEVKRLAAEVRELKTQVKQLELELPQPRRALPSAGSRMITPREPNVHSSHSVPDMKRRQPNARIVSTAAKGSRRRLGVRIVWARDAIGDLPDCYVKISVGQNKMKTGVVLGGHERVTFDFAGSLEISEDAPEILCELIKAGGKIRGKSKKNLIGKVSVSLFEVPHVDISDSAAFDPMTPGDEHIHVESHDYPLFSSNGEPTSEELRMQLLKVTCSGTPKPFSVFAGTWNVGNAPPDSDLGSWLREAQVWQADLIAIGAQECEYQTRPPLKQDSLMSLSKIADSFRLRSTTKHHGEAAEEQPPQPPQPPQAEPASMTATEKLKCHEDWIQAMSSAIGDSHVFVRGYLLGQMRLVIWARMEIVAGITAHVNDWVATGIGKVMTNKGGVSAGLWIWNTSVAFINSHLAAHQNETKKRNQDYSSIVGSLSISGYAACDVLQGFEHIVWMGDLNYRLDFPSEVWGDGVYAKSPPQNLFNHVRKCAEECEYTEMMKHDQLRAAIASGDAFIGFSESDPTFKPTFKVDRDKKISYTSQRLPAYCDRVLWRSSPYLLVSVLDFWSGEQVSTSDHKPVATLLQLEHRPARPSWWPLPSELGKASTSSRRSQSRNPQQLIVNVPKNFTRYLQAWKLSLLTLSGKGLKAGDVSGFSDPFVCFQGDAVLRACTTEARFQTLNPVWKPSTLPVLHIVAQELSDYYFERILVSVLDFDITTSNDDLGGGVLYLRDYMDHTGKPKTGTLHFDITLLSKGIESGALHGTFTLESDKFVSTGVFLKERRKTFHADPPSYWRAVARATGIACFSSQSKRQKMQQHLREQRSTMDLMSEVHPP